MLVYPHLDSGDAVAGKATHAQIGEAGTLLQLDPAVRTAMIGELWLCQLGRGIAADRVSDVANTTQM